MERLLEANMWQGRRWVGVVLSAAVASFMCLGASGPALAAAAGTEVLAWSVNGSVEAGGMYEFGENKSSKFNDYRDMDSGFVGELSLRGEKKESPYFFDLWVKNPARDDGAYSGEFGRYGMFRLELGWDRVRHVLSNTATTMFQENPEGDFTIPSSLRTAITRTPAGFLNGTAANCTGITNWTCPYPVGSSTAPTVNNPQFNFIRDTINGLSRPIDYAFNTDVGIVGLRFTP
ncbi:MAG TPA: MtrB/PioB family outer membrane beta-barrel protein, partial [Dehalococcoidia bacterium]|nr:MtrB/PioB family outer membrane beta-barrel protein [Dehalococcoidia bacterium]